MSRTAVMDVASYLTQKANAKGTRKDFTPLKLQKVLYYAQGWHLAEQGQPLFDSQIFAWKYGPVVQQVYDYYKGRPTAHITPEEAPGDADRVDDQTKVFLDKIWSEYGKKSAWELVGMTHVTQPWLDAFSDPLSDEISNDEIRDYFLSLKL